MSLRFMLRDNPVIIPANVKAWEVVEVTSSPSKVIAYFPGYDNKDYLDLEEARQVAGDYVEFLNEKYIDKNINEEWPPKDPLLYYNYHIQRARHFEEILKKLLVLIYTK